MYPSGCNTTYPHRIYQNTSFCRALFWHGMNDKMNAFFPAPSSADFTSHIAILNNKYILMILRYELLSPLTCIWKVILLLLFCCWYTLSIYAIRQIYMNNGCTACIQKVLTWLCAGLRHIVVLNLLGEGEDASGELLLYSINGVYRSTCMPYPHTPLCVFRLSPISSCLLVYVYYRYVSGTTMVHTEVIGAALVNDIREYFQVGGHGCIAAWFV